MGKFFFRPHEREGQYVKIGGSAAHHMLNVLRFRVGQDIVLCDGECTDYHARLDSIVANPATITFILLSSTPSKSETPMPLTLYQGIPKGDKMEWIIEKCIEAGVSKIIPVYTARTVVASGSAAKKTERYTRIAESAAAQSMRGIVPIVTAPCGFADAIADCNEHDLLLVAYEKEKDRSIRTALEGLPPQPISLWVGPEGGFEEAEITALVEKKAQTVSLGPRILRAETAGLVALAQINCIWE